MTGEDFELTGKEAPLFLAMLLTPIVSIIALLLRGAPNQDWLARYFERKALEERGKLDQLRSSAAPASAPGKEVPERRAGKHK